VILVASAGNNNTSSPQYPAVYSGVITVAATDINDVKGSFSNYGKHVELDGPGVNIISAYPDDLYAMVSGTSFSAPIVAAELALVRSIKFYGVTTSVTSATVNIDANNPKYIGLLGSGRVDILKAVRGY
jgi:subtilisin family serine protease